VKVDSLKLFETTAFATVEPSPEIFLLQGEGSSPPFHLSLIVMGFLNMGLSTFFVALHNFF
jgi:hypothetical protein